MLVCREKSVLHQFFCCTEELVIQLSRLLLLQEYSAKSHRFRAVYQRVVISLEVEEYQRVTAATEVNMRREEVLSHGTNSGIVVAAERRLRRYVRTEVHRQSLCTCSSPS